MYNEEFFGNESLGKVVAQLSRWVFDLGCYVLSCYQSVL